MGILNYTPDSFSDGGLYFTPEKALERAKLMQRLGADIIDVGAQSSRPGAKPLSAREELERLDEVLGAICGKLDVTISADSFYAVCAEAALRAGARIINDVGGAFNPETASLAAEYGAGYVVAHNPRGAAGTVADYEYGAVEDVERFFIDVMKSASEIGLPRSLLCLDPGFGFGKTVEDDFEILGNMKRLKFKGVALLAGASRKRFVGAACGEKNAAARDPGTAAAHAAAIAGGADIIRVHDVASGVQCARVADAVYRGARRYG